MLDTGIFTGQNINAPENIAAGSAPPGCGVIEGRHDHLCRRLDLATGQVVPYQPPPPPDDELQTWQWDATAERWLSTPTAAAIARTARADRDRRIAATDWLITRATERAEPVPAAWLAYRQALRDITEQAGFPTGITWPEEPTP